MVQALLLLAGAKLPARASLRLRREEIARKRKGGARAETAGSGFWCRHDDVDEVHFYVPLCLAVKGSLMLRPLNPSIV